MDVMIDIETLGTPVGSAILTVGAVAFDPQGEPMFEESVTQTHTFYNRVDLQSCLDRGFGIDASTMLWWMTQEDSARWEAFHAPDRLHLYEVLQNLHDWFLTQIGGGDYCVWSHGSGFDIAHLEEAYRRTKLPGPPWHYTRARDTRTLYDVAGLYGAGRTDPRTPHHALSDACAQVRDVQRATRIVKGGRRT